MEIKRPIGAVLGATAAAATLLSDANAQHYLVCVNNAANPVVPILGPIPFGKTRNVRWVNSQAEVRHMSALIGGGETIVANRRYRIEIGNNESLYETAYAGMKSFGYTAPAVLSGNAGTDRANVFTVLTNRVNAHFGLDGVASTVHSWAYTLGSGVAPVNGQVYTQANSNVTMLVIGHTITAGTFAGNNAVGVVHVAFVSDMATLDLAIARVLSGGGSSLTPTTGAGMVAGLHQGIAFRDNAGYFVSRGGRKGISLVQATQGFADTAFIISVQGLYARGIGTVYAQLAAVQYDPSRQDAIQGDIEYELIRQGAFVAGINYRKYMIEVEDGDQDTLAFKSIATKTVYYLWVDEAAAQLVAFHNALVAAALL
jgi:hypothetical protein